MDTEKEEASTNQRSSSSGSRENEHQDHEPYNPDDSGHPHDQNKENENTKAEASADFEMKEESSSGELENKETEEEILNSDEHDEEPSPLPPDLGKVSEEIDQYISCLVSSSEDSTIPPDVPICVEQFAVLVEARTEEYDSSESRVKWTQLKDEDSTSLLEAVSRASKLSASLCKFSWDYKYAYSINRAGSVLQRAMSYLEEEFHSLVEDHRDILDNQYSSSDADQSKPPPKQWGRDAGDQQTDHGESDRDPGGGDEENNNSGGHEHSDEILSQLNKLANAMIAGGYETECGEAYFMARRYALEESVFHRSAGTAFEKHSIDDAQKMSWESLEREIVGWIGTFKQCMNSRFPIIERRLSDAVFLDYPLISRALLSSLSRVMILQLLNFAQAVAMTKRAAEKLFKFLDVYEALGDHVVRSEKLEPECAEEIKSEASLIRSRLGEAMIAIFRELENSIKADTGKTPVPAGGAVHPLTRYIMDYLRCACEYKDTLEQVFREHQKIERADSSGSDFDILASQEQPLQGRGSSPFQTQLTEVMDLLDANLEVKSKLYKDISLSSIFMMNNGRHILQKIRGSAEGLNHLMGDTWCRKRSSELRQYHKNYQRETWGKPLNCLMNHQGLNVNGKVVKPALKERFKSFNAMFDEIHRTQSGWVVGDEQLQSELRVSISNMVIPAYRAFLARYAQIMTPGRQTEKYVKYQPEDIETYIDELFDGNATPFGKKKS